MAGATFQLLPRQCSSRAKCMAREGKTARSGRILTILQAEATLELWLRESRGPCEPSGLGVCRMARRRVAGRVCRREGGHRVCRREEHSNPGLRDTIPRETKP